MQFGANRKGLRNAPPNRCGRCSNLIGIFKKKILSLSLMVASELVEYMVGSGVTWMLASALFQMAPIMRRGRTNTFTNGPFFAVPILCPRLPLFPLFITRPAYDAMVSDSVKWGGFFLLSWSFRCYPLRLCGWGGK